MSGDRTTPSHLVEVVQADRDAAAKFYRECYPKKAKLADQCRAIKAGEWDDHFFVQAFARQGQASAIAEDLCLTLDMIAFQAQHLEPSPVAQIIRQTARSKCDDARQGKAVSAELPREQAEIEVVQAVIEEYCHNRKLPPPLATNVWTKTSVRRAFARHRLSAQRSCDAEVAWQPIETAPAVNGKYFFCRLAWGPSWDRCTGDGFRWNGRWFVAAVFHNGARFDECQNEFRQIEVAPTHWMPRPAPPADAIEAGKHRHD